MLENSDLQNNFNSNKLSYKIFSFFVLTSFIFGLLGGGVGAFYFLNNPILQKEIVKNLALEKGDNKTLTVEQSDVVSVVKKASPAVVSIVVTKNLPQYYRSFDPFGFDPFSDFFDNREPSTYQPQEVGAGSGFFISSDGLILTNKHVVEDEQASYTVITNENKEYEAKVVAIDPRNDLALIKIDAKNFPFLNLADSSQIQIGQQVVAIGYSLGEFKNTVTSGVVSGIGRSITASGSLGSEQLEGVIQTDAAINPGNSGGPLLNAAAEVIGINTAVSRLGQLVGFAIPSNDAKRAVEAYKKTGKISRPFLGIRYIMLNKEVAKSQNLEKDYGALIVRGQKLTDFAVIPGSPADKAGLMENDIVLEIDGNKLEGNLSLASVLKDKNSGDEIVLKVYHKGEEKIVKVRLGDSK